jgi:hypothetical protein
VKGFCLCEVENSRSAATVVLSFKMLIICCSNMTTSVKNMPSRLEKVLPIILWKKFRQYVLLRRR